jgi:sugar O-acyltransferase (sialic acid O-acetyltransferase NeuD family)
LIFAGHRKDIQMDIVVFGCGNFASIVWYMLTHDSTHRVVGFTVDSEYCTAESKHGVPVVPFEELEQYYPPDRVAMFAPLGYRNINGLRADRYHAAKVRGYSFISHVASRAMVWPDLRIGENCMIFDGATINPFAVMGNNCLLLSGSHVSHHVVVGDHCFLAINAVVAGGVKIGERCFLGSNSTIRDKVSLAPRSFIGAGAIVISDTEADGVYVGNPARRIAKSSLEVTGG